MLHCSSIHYIGSTFYLRPPNKHEKWAWSNLLAGISGASFLLTYVHLCYNTIFTCGCIDILQKLWPFDWLRSLSLFEVQFSLLVMPDHSTPSYLITTFQSTQLQPPLIPELWPLIFDLWLLTPELWPLTSDLLFVCVWGVYVYVGMSQKLCCLWLA